MANKNDLKDKKGHNTQINTISGNKTTTEKKKNKQKLRVKTEKVNKNPEKRKQTDRQRNRQNNKKTLELAENKRSCTETKKFLSSDQ